MSKHLNQIFLSRFSSQNLELSQCFWPRGDFQYLARDWGKKSNIWTFFTVYRSRDHLESFSISSGIAFPIQVVLSCYIEQGPLKWAILSIIHENIIMIFEIQLCVTRLMELGLDEEGLFRLSAGQAKVSIKGCLTGVI